MPEFIHISKANDTASDEWRYTLGPVYIPGRTDAHGDSINADDLEKAIHDYVRSGDRTIRLQHQPDTKAGEWVGLLTWPHEVEMPVEYNGEVQKRTYPAGTPFMGVVWEPDQWDRVKNGDLRGYSLGGFAEFADDGVPVGPPTEKSADVSPPTEPTDIENVDPALTGGSKRKRKPKWTIGKAVRDVVLKFQDAEPRDDWGKWTSGPGGVGVTHSKAARGVLLQRDQYIRQDEKYVYAHRHHLDLKVGDQADVTDGENEFHAITKIEHPQRDLTVAHFGSGAEDNFDTWSAYPTIVRVPRKDTVIGKAAVLKFNPGQPRDNSGRWSPGAGGDRRPGDTHYSESKSSVGINRLALHVNAGDHMRDDNGYLRPISHITQNAYGTRRLHFEGGGHFDADPGERVIVHAPKAGYTFDHVARKAVAFTIVAKDYNPGQARDDHGRWTSGGGGGFSGGYKPHDVHSMGEGASASPEDMANMAGPLKDANGKFVYDSHGEHVMPYSAQHIVNGQYTPERQALHEQIINAHLDNVSRPKGQPTQFMNGGGPGSGKSAIRKHPDANYPATREVHEMTGEMPATTADAVLIDPDAIKMMLPETKAARAAGDTDWAARSHEESSYLGKRIHQAAVDRGLNVVYDGTGDSGVKGVQKKVKIARDRGYRVEANYVYLHPDEGVRRAADRGRRTGRIVPETQIRHTYSDIPPTFDGVKEGVFDHVRLLDNNVGNFQPATVVGETGADGKFQVNDPEAYKRFLHTPGA